MTSKRFFTALAILACSLLLPSSAPAQTGDYVIGPQDVLTIAVFEQADLGGKYAVELDGSFTFPLVGRVKAGGLTIKEFEGALRTRLADGFFKNPQVSVAIDQYRSQKVFITGEVRSPGTYALTGDMTLIEALAKAGSTTANASDEVTVVRAGRNEQPGGGDEDADTVKVKLKDLQTGAASAQNVELRDGDTIYVARAEIVYVFGQVRNPASYAITSETTVLQALSLAGGVAANGAINRTRIIRVVNGEKRDIKVKLTDTVQPGDTVVVPERFF